MRPIIWESNPDVCHVGDITVKITYKNCRQCLTDFNLTKRLAYCMAITSDFRKKHKKWAVKTHPATALANVLVRQNQSFSSDYHARCRHYFGDVFSCRLANHVNSACLVLIGIWLILFNANSYAVINSSLQEQQPKPIYRCIQSNGTPKFSHLPCKANRSRPTTRKPTNPPTLGTNFIEFQSLTEDERAQLKSQKKQLQERLIRGKKQRAKQYKQQQTKARARQQLCTKIKRKLDVLLDQRREGYSLAQAQQSKRQIRQLRRQKLIHCR